VILFLWTAVLKPLIAWLRGEPLGKKLEGGPPREERQGARETVTTNSSGGAPDDQALR